MRMKCSSIELENIVTRLPQDSVIICQNKRLENLMNRLGVCTNLYKAKSIDKCYILTEDRLIHCDLNSILQSTMSIQLGIIAQELERIITWQNVLR